MSTITPKEIVRKVWDLIPEQSQQEWMDITERYDIIDEWTWVRTTMRQGLIRVYHALLALITPDSKPIEMANLIEQQDRIVEALGLILVNSGIHADTMNDIATLSALKKKFKISEARKSQATSVNVWYFTFAKEKVEHAHIDIVGYGYSREEAEIDAWKKLGELMAN